MKKIADTVAELALPIVLEQGCELWDVEYVKEAGEWFLRVYIDNADGVTIDMCEAVSIKLGEMLDEIDIIPDSYTFEVASAGVERVLKRPSDFEKFIGSRVEVRLYKSRDGRKEYIGKLLGYENGDVEIEWEEKSLLFKKGEIALVRLRI